MRSYGYPRPTMGSQVPLDHTNSIISTTPGASAHLLVSRRTPFPTWYHCDCCTISPPRLSLPFLHRPYRLSLPDQPYPGVGPFGFCLHGHQDTVLPLCYRDCPYMTPMSGLFYRFIQAFQFAFLSTFRRISEIILPKWTSRRMNLKEYVVKCKERLFGGLQHDLDKSAIGA